jgi:hypothetical protein
MSLFNCNIIARGIVVAGHESIAVVANGPRAAHSLSVFPQNLSVVSAFLELIARTSAQVEERNLLVNPAGDCVLWLPPASTFPE